MKTIQERQAAMNAKLKEIQADMAKKGIHIDVPIFKPIPMIMPQFKR